MLIGILGLADGAHVEARLVGERTGPHIGRLRVQRPVEQFGDVVADGGEAREPALGEALESHLDLEVRDHGGEVGVAGALAEPVHAALHLTGTAADCSHGVRHGTTGVVVAVDRDRDVLAEVRLHDGNDGLHLVRKRPAVRVAEDKVRRTLDGSSLERAHRELGIALVAIEEVFGVHHHPETVGTEELHGVSDHRLALVERGAQRVQHVVVPCLGDDADRPGLRLDEIAQRRVVVHLAHRAAGGAKGDQPGGGQPQFDRRTCEELDVFRVRARPATLDVRHAEKIQLFGNAQLVLHGCRHTLYLHAVAQGGVEDLDVFTLVAHRLPLVSYCLGLGAVLAVGVRETKEPPEGAALGARGVPTCATE